MQVFNFTSSAETRGIRNLKPLDFVYYSTPGSTSWKRIRQTSLPLFVLGLMFTVIWPTVFIFLDVRKYAQGVIEWAAIGSFILLMTFPHLYGNVDILLMRCTTVTALIDFVALLVVCSLLLLFGQGFVGYGVAIFLGFFQLAYSTEALEMASRMNMKTVPSHVRILVIMMYIASTYAATAARASVFLRQVTVSNDIILGEIPGSLEGPITLRDFWEFWVDLIIVRLYFLNIERISKPQEPFQISLGPAYARYTDPTANV